VNPQNPETPTPSPAPSDAEWRHFLAHDHYVWHSARPRVRQATVELRAACQQPWGEHMAAQALQLAIVEAWRDLEAWVVGDLFRGDEAAAWRCMHALHAHVVAHGLAQPSRADLDRRATRLVDLAEAGRGDPEAVEALMRRSGVKKSRTVRVAMAACRGDAAWIADALAGPFGGTPESAEIPTFEGATPASAENEAAEAGMPVPLTELVAGVLERCEAALAARGRGEEVMLQPLFERQASGENPAQTARRVSKEGGLQALLQHLAIPPAAEDEDGVGR
jgi:hypothetical protein